MLRKALSLVHPLKFETQEMKISYSHFQIENEKTLLLVYNIMISVLALTFLVFGFINKLPVDIMIGRITILILSVISFFLKTKYPFLRKLLLLLLTAGSMLFFLLRLGLLSQNRLEGAFIIGNVVGLNEMSLILIFKDARLRLFTYIIFVCVKVFGLVLEFAESPSHSTIFFIFVLFTFAVFLFNNMLDIRIFKVIQEAKDKLTKFQELLSNDLPSSVIIISSNLKQIVYSNKFFQTTFQAQAQGVSSNSQEYEDNIQIFNNFIIKQVTNSQLEPLAEVSLIEFLKKIDLEPPSIANETRVFEFDASYKNQTNNKFQYHIKLRKIIWDGRRSYAMVLHDISDKEVLAVLRLADEQKDRVIATVSHELRTPINGIMGLLEMIRTRTNDALSLSYLENAKSCSMLLLYLVNSILDLSQIRHNSELNISNDSIDFTKFVEELMSLYIFHSQQKGIEFSINLDPLVPKNIITDKYRLIEILINLLGNAMKFTFKGSIKLNVFVDRNDKRKLMFSVEDTGIGIQEKDKPKLFKMFGKIEQADQRTNSQGVGLGLTIANELVKLLNSRSGSWDERIQFESEFGKGSQFWFRIPINADSDSISFLSETSLDLARDFDFTEKGVKELSPKTLNEFDKNIVHLSRQILTENPFNKSSNIELEINTNRGLLKCDQDSFKKVLIVDDSPFNLLAATFVLEQLGYRVRKAYNGKEALEILELSQTREERYCLILTDIQMPVLDGLEMSKIIMDRIKKGEVYKVPIVAVTAKKLSDQDLKIYGEYGIDFTLEKPLVLNDIKNVLDKLFLLE